MKPEPLTHASYGHRLADVHSGSPDSYRGLLLPAAGKPAFTLSPGVSKHLTGF
jgi:hypothetical protein